MVMLRPEMVHHSFNDTHFKPINQAINILLHICFATQHKKFAFYGKIQHKGGIRSFYYYLLDA